MLNIKESEHVEFLYYIPYYLPTSFPT
jgi:hypothetical protein